MWNSESDQWIIELRDYIKAAKSIGKGIDLGWFAHATTINICGPRMRKCSTKVEWNNKIDLTKSSANYDGKDSKVHGFFRRPGGLAPFFVDVWIFGGAQERHVRVEPNDACLGSQITDLGFVGFLWLPLWQIEGEILKKQNLPWSCQERKGEMNGWYLPPLNPKLSTWVHDIMWMDCMFTDICETVRK